ncbi:MAG: glycosyltransferase family 2 protein [Synergistaceae bacterium]|nr:glycosyltransferase family 2 protein [Synergistaceae bacterium]
MSKNKPKIAIILPCYNEEKMLPITFVKIHELLDSLKRDEVISQESFALFVDDGSTDKTWELILLYHSKDENCRGIKLAANAGHQNALMAGMMKVKGLVECCITMDADLQDDLSAIPVMLAHYSQKSEIVYGVRCDRSTDSYFKHKTAAMFYSLMKALGVNLLPNHADFRLVGSNALENLSSFREYNLFLRGIFPSMGFKTATVEYAQLPRLASETKYSLRKMLTLATRGVTMFSPAPLRLSGLLSIFVFIAALIQAGMVIIDYSKGITVPGWASLMVIILFIGSAQLFCNFVMGEYIAMIFSEVKARPRYIIEEET